MKKILSYIIMGILGVTVFTACSDDESYLTPTALDASTLSYEAKAGAVKLKWKIPGRSYDGLRLSLYEGNRSRKESHI